MRIKGEGTFGFEKARKLHTWKLIVDSTPVVRKAKTTKELMVKVAKVRRELEDTGQVKSDVDRGYTAEAWFTEWLEVYVKPHRAKNTHRAYRQTSVNYIIPGLRHPVTGKSRKLKDLTVTDCQRAINRVVLELKLSSTTAMHTRDVMKRGLRKAQALGLIKTNPAEHTSPVTPQESTRRSLPPEMVPVVIEEALRKRELRTRPGELAYVHRNGPAIALLLAVGVRIGECLGFYAIDINLRGKPKPTIRIERQMDWDEGWWEITPLKGTKKNRTIPISANAVRAIEARMEIREKDLAGAGEFYQDYGLLFADQTGGPLTERNVQRSLDVILRDVDKGLPMDKKLGHYSLHELRHTVATMMARNGVPQHILQKFMGHASAATTAKYYLHTFDNDLNSAIETMDTLAPVVVQRATM